FPVILTLPSSFSGPCLTPTQFDCKKAACCAIMGCGGREVVYYSGFHQCLLCAVGYRDGITSVRRACIGSTTRQCAPSRRLGTFGLAVAAACAFSLHIAV